MRECDHDAYIYDPNEEIWKCRDCNHRVSSLDAEQKYHIGNRVKGHVNDESETSVEGIVEGIEYDDGYLNKVRVIAHTGHPEAHTEHYDGFINLWDFEIDELITDARRHHFDA